MARERKKTITTRGETLRFEKALEMAQKQLKSTVKEVTRESHLTVKDVDDNDKQEQDNILKDRDEDSARAEQQACSQAASNLPSPAKPPRVLLEKETETMQQQHTVPPVQSNKQQQKSSDVSHNVSTVTEENSSRLSTFGSQLVTSTPNGGGKEVTAAVSSVTSPSSVGSQRSSRSSLCPGDDELSGHVADSSRTSSAPANQASAPVDATGEGCNGAKKRSLKKIPPPPPPRKGSRVTARAGTSNGNPYVSVAVNHAQAAPMSPPTYENIQKYSGGSNHSFDNNKSPGGGVLKSPSRLARPSGTRDNSHSGASGTVEARDKNVSNAHTSRTPSSGEVDSSDSSGNSHDTIKRFSSTKITQQPSLAAVASPTSPTSPKSIMKQTSQSKIAVYNGKYGPSGRDSSGSSIPQRPAHRVRVDFTETEIF